MGGASLFQYFPVSFPTLLTLLMTSHASAMFTLLTTLKLAGGVQNIGKKEKDKKEREREKERDRERDKSRDGHTPDGKKDKKGVGIRGIRAFV